MMREYSTTTWAGSCTPQNTAEPSMAGVKNGRPAMTSMSRNQRATAPAPTSPAMNLSRMIRVSCIDSLPRMAPDWEYGVSLTPGASPTDPGRKPGDHRDRPPRNPGLAPGVGTYDLVGNTTARPHDFLPTARVPAVPTRRLAARGRGGRAPSRHRGPGRPEPARRDRPEPGVARDPLGVPVQLPPGTARPGGGGGKGRRPGGGEPGPGRRDARTTPTRPSSARGELNRHGQWSAGHAR